MTETATARTTRPLSIAAGVATLIAALGLFLGAFSGTAVLMPWVVGIGVFVGLITLAIYFFTRR